MLSHVEVSFISKPLEKFYMAHDAHEIISFLLFIKQGQMILTNYECELDYNLYLYDYIYIYI